MLDASCYSSSVKIAPEERFWSKVDKDGPIPEHCPELGPCWVWTGARNKRKGYGAIRWGTKSSTEAHRVGYELQVGPAGSSYVLHRCDNRACVRGTHLFLGTAADNARDMIQKRRQAFGEAHPAAKLTRHKVREIRRLKKKGLTQQARADLFNVSQPVISAIDRGKLWRL
jgi:hypothetical protein